MWPESARAQYLSKNVSLAAPSVSPALYVLLRSHKDGYARVSHAP